jgi:hypothetical protein
MLLKKSFWLTVVLAASAHAAERPRIVGILPNLGTWRLSRKSRKDRYWPDFIGGLCMMRRIRSPTAAAFSFFPCLR